MPRSTGKPPSSEATSLQPLGSALERLIGNTLGKTGSVVPLTTEAGLPRVPALQVGQSVRTEEMVDRAASWPPPLRSAVVGSRWADRSSTEAGWDGFPVAYEIAAEVEPATADLAAQLLEGYRQLCAPMAPTDLALLLGKLRTRLAKRSTEDTDWALELDDWIDDLSDFPADIVAWALGFWRRNEKFWPTWAELLPLLERRTAQRKAAMDALRTIIERGRASQRAAE